MTLQIDDLLGLNPVMLDSMPVAHNTRSLQSLIKNSKTPVSVTGSRHSQGGHTVFPDSTALLTEPMNRVISVDEAKRTVTAEAGTTWSVLHAHLAPLGLAPLVQQSSPHFTLGGSISVNCHGRDPRQGPLANSIVCMQVLAPSSTSGQPVTVCPGDALFKAVVGGYGSAAVILSVTLRVTDNPMLRQQAKEMSLKDYAQQVQQRQTSNDWPELHYAWLNFSANALFKTVLKVDCHRDKGEAETVLHEDGWLEIEAMRWLWEQHSDRGRTNRTAVWQTLVNYFKSQNLERNGLGKQLSRIDGLRQSVGFTAHRSETRVGLLQEYFVPLHRMSAFVTALGQLIRRNRVNLLSSTVRVVQKEASATSHLSYAPNQAMACIALDFDCPLDIDKTTHNRIPDQASVKWVREAIDLAYQHGGRYYLPYYGLASLEQFNRAYPGASAQRSARDPKLNNLFIDTYLK